MLKLIWILWILIKLSHNCGISTHTEVIQRALANYDNPAFGSGEILKIIQNHQGAFQAGAPFPDVFYNTLCQNGDLHSVSEDVHWGRYQKVAWDYFRYVRCPWNLPFDC